MTDAPNQDARRGVTFQNAIGRLDAYWSGLGCVLWLPHNVEVGAGTMNPATFLRVLGPEPWNVGYVEPSVRPDDARYGENPNRVGRHHQYQVILKPDPGDPQQLYLDSLTTLGIDLASNDVRFVEDNWESPALGAWGLGWEVWLNGLEITQFTYFQQSGSVDLDPVSVEITYGLDRILMALQDVRHFKELCWNEWVDIGSLLLDYEVDTSRYYFEASNVDRLSTLYETYEQEARAALDRSLVTVAYDYLLKCSHTFNLLDARGAVGVTERARYFGRMRRLAAEVASIYVERREEEGFPLLAARPDWVAGREAPAAPSEAPTPLAPEPPLPSESADFLLEVGTEELPVADVDSAREALAEGIAVLLADLRLGHGRVEAWATPRRLVVLVHDLAPRQKDVEEQVVGPPRGVAFDADGRPTRAAEGFARSVGVDVGDLAVIERGGEERVAAVRRETGRPAGEVLGPSLAALLGSLSFPRSMRWNPSQATFSRPVRWIAALHGASVVPLHYAGIDAGRRSRGTRPSASPPFDIASAGAYRGLAEAHGIVLDVSHRERLIEDAVGDLVREVDGTTFPDPALLREVANLVEEPFGLRGDFDPSYLELPSEVLVTVMKKHQRYFPVATQEGGLLPHFVTVANGADLDPDLVRRGNEAVIGARFADAAFFWRQDIKKPLEAYTPDLARLTFETRLGSMLDKVERLRGLVPQLADALDLAGADRRDAEQAAALAKSDLATSLVVELTSLQGIIGKEYALRSGESEAVAVAIYEQYLPRSAGDLRPQTPAGTVLALADRLDTLTSLFAIGVRPSGTQDPFGLRRAALGIGQIVMAGELALDLEDAVDLAGATLPDGVDLSAEDRRDILAFLRRRVEGLLRDTGLRADVVAAALAASPARPTAAARAAAVLERRVTSAGWEDTLNAYARCARIVRGEESATTIDPAGLEDTAEQALYDALQQALAGLDRDNPEAVMDAVAALREDINRFFDQVLVMDPDASRRANRLALVRGVAEIPHRVADLSELEGF